MAKTSYITISGEAESLFYKHLRSGDRLTLGKIVTKKTLFSRRSIKGLTAKSLLPQIATLWNALTTVEKNLWSVAGAQCALKGYRLFVQDTTARIKNGYSGVATPSELHQSWVGELKIASPATELKIQQIHPNKYWVLHKVSGKKGMYEPVTVTENFSLPLTLSLNYKSNLVSAGANPFAKYYAEIWHSYQGVDLFTSLDVDLDLVSDWKNAETVLSSVIGQIIGYTLYIYLHDVRGTVLIDNVQAAHGGQNWVRDTYCKNIQQTFTKAYYQIPNNWAAVELPTGSEYATIYPED